MMLQELVLKDTRIGYWFQLQMAFKKGARTATHEARNLSELRRGEHGVLDHIDLPEAEAHRLMELGFLPGQTVTSCHAAPGGDPRVFRVDGAEIALRRETARKLVLRAAS